MYGQLTHYDYTSIQLTVIFHGCKNDYFQMKNCHIDSETLIFTDFRAKWGTLLSLKSWAPT